MTKENEARLLKSMGIRHNIPFKLVAMNGTFVVDIDTRTVTDVSGRLPIGVVQGMYDNLLRGVYRKDWDK